MRNININLKSHRDKCTGCGACFNICSTNAIQMKEDAYGFKYPYVNDEKCINCSACLHVCPISKIVPRNKVIKTLVATSKNIDIKKRSASGGLFAEFAKVVLSKNGIVYGSSMEYNAGKLFTKHIRIDNIDDLSRLQGSKYVQSDIGDTYKRAKEDLENGLFVLYSGTPCQIAGIKNFLKKNYNKLILIDIICHGVPSEQMFQDYISVIEKQKGISINNFLFRDKDVGWGLDGSYSYEDNNIKKVTFKNSESSYYKFFLDSEIYRDNCYKCEYANCKRVGDLTIGDFWGVDKFHPEIFTINGGFFSKKEGISCLIINNLKGINFLELSKENFFLYESEYDKAAHTNHQLRRASIPGRHRDKIMELYKNNGYESVEKYYRVLMRILKIKKIVAKIVPKRLLKAYKND